MEMTLDYLKNILVPALFPSEEDGDPNKYHIDFFVDENDELLITLESVIHIKLNNLQ